MPMEHDVCRRCGSMQRDEWEVERLLEEWRVALESGGMRINRTKTEYNYEMYTP